MRLSKRYIVGLTSRLYVQSNLVRGRVSSSPGGVTRVLFQIGEIEPPVSRSMDLSSGREFTEGSDKGGEQNGR